MQEQEWIKTQASYQDMTITIIQLEYKSLLLMQKAYVIEIPAKTK